MKSPANSYEYVRSTRGKRSADVWKKHAQIMRECGLWVSHYEITVRNLALRVLLKKS